MARKRTAGRTAARQDGSAVKLTLTIPADLARRFGVHAEMTGVTRSALFAELVRAGCRRFVVSDRERAPDGQEPEAVPHL